MNLGNIGDSVRESVRESVRDLVRRHYESR